MIREVPGPLIMDLWPVVEPHLAKAARHHPFASTEVMLLNLMERKSSLFVILEDDAVAAAVLIELEEYPGGRLVGQVWAMGGKAGILKRWQPKLEEALDAWCIRHGCDTLAVVGRPGWRRLLRDFESIPLTLAWRAVHVPGRATAAVPSERRPAGPTATPTAIGT